VLSAENAVFTLQRSVHAEASGVGRKLCDAHGNFLWKEKLTGVADMAAYIRRFTCLEIGVNLEMNVNGAAGIPARVQRPELHTAQFVGTLYAAQKAGGIQVAMFGLRRHGRAGIAGVEHGWTKTAAAGRATRRSIGIHFRKTGIDAEGIAMPNVDGGVFERPASFCVQKHHPKLQRKTRLSFRDISPDCVLVNVVRTFFLLGRERTIRRLRLAPGQGGSATDEKSPARMMQRHITKILDGIA
jgi:hypothetical protein